MRQNKSFRGLLPQIVVGWFLVTFVLLPNFGLLQHVFWSGTQITWAPFHKIFTSAIAMHALGNSLILGLSLAVTANLVGIFMALVVSYFDIKGARWLQAGYLTTIIYSGIVVATGYLFVYGRTGFVTRWLQQVWPHLSPDWFTGFPAVLFLMTFAATANHMMFLTTCIQQLDFQTIEAARSLGANQWQILTQIVLPALVPTLTTLTIMLFNTGLGAMSAPLILGGDHFSTITPTILTFTGNTGTYNLAAALSLLLGLMQVVLLLLGRWLDRRKRYAFKTKVPAPMRKQKINQPFVNGLVHGVAYLIWLILLLPVGATIIFSLTSALAAILIGLVVARAVTRRQSAGLVNQTLAGVMYLPWLLPAPLIAIGLITTFGSAQLLVGNQILTGGLSLLLIGYTITRLPFSLRFLESLFYSVDANTEEAAQSMGAPALYRFGTVVLPQMKAGVLAILAMNILAHLSDYDLSVFLFSPLVQPLGVAIRANTDPANAVSGDGTVNGLVANLIYSVILMVIGAILLLVLRRQSDQVTSNTY
ncbi:MAG: ABC transporter permease [Leuconostoc lactis]|uniref:ABC transporter permease n=1 Tax=Leuconostoc lactis TaxID=1246 RepID=UPI003991E7F7